MQSSIDSDELWHHYNPEAQRQSMLALQGNELIDLFAETSDCRTTDNRSISFLGSWWINFNSWLNSRSILSSMMYPIWNHRYENIKYNYFFNKSRLPIPVQCRHSCPIRSWHQRCRCRKENSGGAVGCSRRIEAPPGLPEGEEKRCNIGCRDVA